MKRLLYRSYRISSGVLHWGRQRFTPAGLGVLLVLGVVPNLGTNLETATGPRVFLLGASLLLVSLVFLPFFRGHFEVERSLPRCASVGGVIQYTVRVTNRTKRTWRGLEVEEEMTDTRLSFAAFVARLRPARRTRSMQLSSNLPGRRVKITRGRLPTLAPGDSALAEMEMVPWKRGVVHFAGLAVTRTDPLGLLRSRIRRACPETLIVLPRRYPAPIFELPGNPKYQPGGVALASRVGASEEFLALREYRPGDPLRRIHWRSWARTGEPVTKEYQDEIFTRHALVLDTFAGAEREWVFEEAVSVAASLASQTRAEESLLDLMFAGDRAYRVTAGRGLGHAGQLLEVLAAVSPVVDRDFAVLRNLVLEHAGELSGAVCVFVEWDEARRELVQQLAARRIPLEVFVVTSPPPGERPVPGALGAAVGFHVLVAGQIREGLAHVDHRKETT